VAKFIDRYIETGSLLRKPERRPLQQMKAIVEAKMRKDDKILAYHLCSLLLSHDFTISKRTVTPS